MDKYHQKFADQSDAEIQNKLNAKKDELIAIFKQIPFSSSEQSLSLAVLGCGDKRFIKGHKKIFEEVLSKQVEVTTFDITIEHLQGEERVIEHDCTLALPRGPFTFTYAHVLLKFIPTEKQWNLIKNSFNALEDGGMAIHVLDKNDYESSGKKLSDGYFAVPLKRWTKKMQEVGIKYREITVKYGLALVLLK